MKRLKQKIFNLGPFYVNIFNVPTKKFDNVNWRIAVHCKYFDLLFTLKDSNE